MTALLFALCFAAAFFLALFALDAADEVAGPRGRLRRRLRRLAAPDAPADDAEEGILRERGPSRRWLDRLALHLERAGAPIGRNGFLAASAFLGLFGVLVGSGAGPVGLLLGAVAAALPWLLLLQRQRSRMRRFEQMFPDALDLLARALRAGHALSAGLQMVGEELDDPVGPEFSRVSEEIRLGLDVNSALSDLARRIDVPEMPFFVTALLIQRETGGNLAEIIDGLAHVIRERHAMNGKIRAVTAQTRWSAHILLIAPFAFAGAMSLLRPGYVAPLWDTPLGNFLAGAACLMVLVGYALCRRLGAVRV